MQPYILIVDDEPVNIKVLSEILKSDYSISFATNGEEAIEIVTSEIKPDIILLDIIMPGISGYEVCRTLKKIPGAANIPVVFISAMGMDEDEQKGLALGAVDYIRKPFSPSVLKTRVKNHLELKMYRDNLEKMVEERTSQLINSDRLATIGTFSTGIAHEVNNPNSFISGNIQTLALFWNIAEPILKNHMDEDKSGKIKIIINEIDDIIEGIKKGSDRIKKIVDNLKSYARQDTYADFSLCDLTEPVNEAIVLLKHRIMNNVIFEINIAKELKLLCNKQKLSQVFVNLINNAADAFNGEKGTIKISSMVNNNKIIIKVSDNGPGIKTENHMKIFTPLFTTKGKTSGTGLGLSIISEIIENHKGSFYLNTSFKDGSEFIIELPAN